MPKKTVTISKEEMMEILTRAFILLEELDGELDRKTTRRCAVFASIVIGLMYEIREKLYA